MRSDDPRGRAIWGAVCLAAALVAVDATVPREPEIVATRIGSLVRLTWEPVEGVVIYEVQGRLFQGEWSTIGMSTRSWIVVPIDVGAFDFRVRAWTPSGPKRWSPATAPVWRLPAPRPPELLWSLIVPCSSFLSLDTTAAMPYSTLYYLIVLYNTL